ncbi:hypothetical protein [Belnapia moabensis]|nr:hypothetical protein [Belnapia moabensis]
MDALLAEAALSMGDVDGLAWAEHAARGATGTTFDEGRLGLD